MATTAWVGMGEASEPASAAEVSPVRPGDSLVPLSFVTELGVTPASSGGVPGGVSAGGSTLLHAAAPAMGAQ